jgi:alpha/beta superfamily hydrolase
MDSPVVVRAAEVCRASGLTTLCFNFRGVGRSTGVHAAGEGELEDVRGAHEFLRARLGPSAPLGVIGYSFGAWVGGRASRHDPRVGGLLLIAPPLAFFDFGFLRGFPSPVLLVAGSRDSYCPRRELQALAASLGGGECALIDQADHFFSGKLYPLGEAIAAWARVFSGVRPGKATGDSGPR